MLNILRHPLYMLVQNHLSIERVVSNNSPRSFALNYKYNGHELNFWTKEWKELFIKSNAIDRAIYYLVKLLHRLKI